MAVSIILFFYINVREKNKHTNRYKEKKQTKQKNKNRTEMSINVYIIYMCAVYRDVNEMCVSVYIHPIINANIQIYYIHIGSRCSFLITKDEKKF